MAGSSLARDVLNGRYVPNGRFALTALPKTASSVLGKPPAGMDMALRPPLLRGEVVVSTVSGGI
ncbi:unnamed protein product [Penicillium roqueforti FM164]|uniref:Genomic scaffold, ProqFM164S02 n=1 Tax=Penicillium roqueforti (strain FM164) TaxID=1365484 RepID=W6Q5G1_PENRF|nr:unnamed protein product [Penicillium roqueforti FM164]